MALAIEKYKLPYIISFTIKKDGCAANAKWDKDYKIDGYLKHVMDDKPITARQCIKVLPIIAKYKPDLIDCVTNALHNANTQIYKSSMQSLVYKDIQDVLKKIELLWIS